MPVILGLIGVLLAWLGWGHPLHPPWLLTLIPLGLWIAGLTTKIRTLFSLGFWGFVILSAILTVFGKTSLGLATLGVTILAWDGLSFQGATLLGVAKRYLWSTLTVGVGIGFALAALFLRVTVNFWAIMGVLFSAWFLLRLFAREAVHGGERSGNRSKSAPMT